MRPEIKEFMEALKAKTVGEAEFHQAVEEVIETVWDTYQANPKYKANKILEKMVEPERVIMFRVPWIDDKGEVQINRGYRVQFNSAIGPYKGGLRFHPSVTLGGLKFLGFEQTFKNSLTTLPMGGGKGGSDFNPKGKSDNEVMRFCQSFMTELCKYIGADTDVPAGDIGVGAREIGYLFGQYKRIRNEFVGVLTGKPREFGGSRVRPEATGYGTVYFAQHMLKEKGQDISGFGNVAWGAAQKLVQLGAKLVTISGPDGYIYDEKGLTQEGVDYMLELRASNNDVVEPYAAKFGAKFFAKKKPWEVKCDIAFPCAIQNELNEEDAKQLVANGCQMVVETSNMGCTAEAVKYLNSHITFAPGKAANGCIAVSEGANMPSTPEAIKVFQDAKILYAPGKAANAGGVAVSGLEMSQNSMRYSWTAEEVDQKLSQIMKDIHDTCVKFGKEGDKIDYVKGANIGGFIKVAEAMCAQGHV